MSISTVPDPAPWSAAPNRGRAPNSDHTIFCSSRRPAAILARRNPAAATVEAMGIVGLTPSGARGRGPDNADCYAELARERERLAAEMAGLVGHLWRLLFRRIPRAAQRFAPYREESLFYMGAGWPTLRRLALELVGRLVAAGSPFESGNVFYLRTAELAAGSAARVAGQSRPELAGLARERGELRQARRRLHPPAAVPVDFRWKGASRSGATRSPDPRCPGSRSAPAA
jgi:hypothetical protein